MAEPTEAEIEAHRLLVTRQGGLGPGRPRRLVRRHPRYINLNRHRLLRIVLGTIVVAALSPARGASPLVRLASYPGAQAVQDEGFDTCTNYTSSMNAIWSNSPENARNFGAYLGGETAGAAGCFVPPASWYAAQFQTGWQISLIYDGVQDPCSGNTNTFPLNNASADYTEGQNAGYNAEDAATALGFTSPSIFLWYYLEPYNTTSSACVSAAQSFMQGYTSTMGVPTLYMAGFYGAASGSDPLAMLSVSSHPAYYWLAYYDGNPNVYDMGGYISTTIWVNNQRMKQWFGNPPDGLTTLGGVNYNLDRDCSQTYVQTQYGVSDGC